ncbi:UTP11-like, U3 small nucleolar ribonucleoprotein [Dinochytrium kinnereticum]|nr:UTP11-like, U3 small nucleolar ribonucleoprotein [Dinochytrium kinnereticum]
MSSLRNSAPRKAHRERSQLQSRAHLGLLEKKKDYVLRAKDYNSKQRRLKAMREKALMKNPDEFYFAMINSKVKDGVHTKSKTRDNYDQDYLKLLKTQDQNYVNYHRSINLKKIEKLSESLALDGVMPDPMDHNEGETPANVKRPGSHTIFVEDEDEAHSFDPSVYLKFSSLKNNLAEEEPENCSEENSKTAKPKRILDPKVIKQREALRKELVSRKTREDKLRQMQQEMELQKNLMGKGAKKKIGKDSNGLAVYKWKMERKK